MKTKLLSMLFAAVLLTGCGGESKKEATVEEEPTKLSAAQTELKGDLKGCYEVVEKEYKLKYESYYGDIISVELKRTDKALPFDADKVDVFSNESSTDKTMLVGFGIEFLDEDGDVLDVIQPSDWSYSSKDVISLFGLQTDDTGIIRWKVDKDIKPVKFRITSLTKAHTPKAKESDALDKAIEKALDTDDSDVKENLDDVKKAAEATKKAAEAGAALLDLLK